MPLNRGRTSRSRSSVQERKRRRSQSSSSASLESHPSKKRPVEDHDDDKGAAGEDNTADMGKSSQKRKRDKRPKGSKLFKQAAEEHGNGDGKATKASTGTVEYWNDERAKLGLKPLK